MLLCATTLRPPATTGPAAIARLAAATGCGGIAVAGDVTLPLCGAVAAEALAAGLAAPLFVAPLSEGPLAPGRRLPHLAARTDRDERDAAVALALRTMEAAAELGARTLSLEMGPITLHVREEEIARAFARRELDKGEPAAARLAAALAERRALGPALVDACRFSLEKLLAAAARRGFELAVAVAGTPWGAPSPREALDLCVEFRGAPLGVTLGGGRLAAQAALGLPLSDGRRAALAAEAKALWLDEAVGLEAGFLPGLGDPDAAPLGGVGAGALRVLAGKQDATEAEVAAAVASSGAVRG